MDTRVMSIPRMNYPQYRKARRLTHECCNYCNGNCLLLDDGEECVCVQSISYSLLCRWFQAAVLPLDAALYAEIIKDRDEVKRCCECGPRSSRSLTGPNTARPAPNGCDAVRRPSASGKDTGSTKHKKRCRTQAATWPPRPALCYLLLQTIA